MDYYKLDNKVRTIMFCLYWELPPKQHYHHFKTFGALDCDSWFRNSPENKEKYYEAAQEYLRKDKIGKIKNGLR